MEKNKPNRPCLDYPYLSLPDIDEDDIGENVKDNTSKPNAL